MPTLEEVPREWRKVYNAECHYLHPSSDIGVVKPRRVTRVGKMKTQKGFGGENKSERDYLEDTGVDKGLIFKWILKKVWDMLVLIYVAQIRTSCVLM